MRCRLTPLLLLLLSSFARGQCPAPDLFQVVENQRSAVVYISGISSAVDSVQVLLGGEFFLSVTDRFDSVYTFGEDLSQRAFILYGLEPGTNYRVIARAFCDGEVSPPSSGRGLLFKTDSVGPPTNDERGRALILAGASRRCVYLPATTRDATASEVTNTACTGADDDDVWFSLRQFYDDYGVKFRPVEGTDQDLVIEVYNVQGQRLNCIDAGGDGEPEAYEVYGLEEDEDRYFRVYTKGEGGYADFEYCNFALNRLPVAQGTGCTDAPAVTFDGQGEATRLVDIVDTTGALIVSIENTQPLGEVNVSYYSHAGELRQTGTNRARYASRNISIVPTTQPSDTVGVRLYLSEAEVSQLFLSGAITRAGELDVTKVTTAVCSTTYPGGGEAVEFRGAGRFGTGYFVDVAVTGFSEFFVHPAAESLVATTAVTDNNRTELPWGIAPNPVTDRLTLTAPIELEQVSVIAEIYNATGQRVSTTQLPAGKQRSLDTFAWPRGVYVLVLSGGGRRVSARLVK